METPAFDGVTSFDEFAARLGALRTRAGLPSYTTLAARVARARAARGVPAGEATPGRITVYECFRPGRRRMDVQLVADLVRAMGVGEADVAHWVGACLRLHEATATAVDDVASVRVGLPDAAQFVGRVAELAALRDADGLVVVDGMAGAGKTHLVARAGQDLVDRGAVEVVLFASLRGFAGVGRPPVSARAVLAGFLHLLGVPGTHVPASEADRAARFRALTGERRVLVVLDDVGTAAQVRPLLPDGPLCRTWVTSRRALDALPAHQRLTLGPMSRTDAVDLLRAKVGADVIDDDTTAAADVARLCGDLPLAVSLLAGRVRTGASTSLAAHRDRLLAQHTKIPLDDAVTAALDVSRDSLPEPVRLVLRGCALHPGDRVTAAEAAVLAATDLDAAQAALTALATENLLRPNGSEGYTMHDVVRAYTARLADPAERDLAVRRLLDHYVARCTAAVSVLHPSRAADWSWSAEAVFDSAEAARTWLDASCANVLAAHRLAVSTGRWEAAVRLSVLLAWHLYHRGRFTDAVALHDATRVAARRLGDRAAEAIVERNIGHAANRMGQDTLAERHYTRALALARESGDRRNEAMVLNGIAGLAIHRCDHDAAITHLEQALTAAPAGQDVSIRNNLAVCLFRTGRLTEALNQYQRAAASARRTGDRQGERVALTNSAAVYLELGRHELARYCAHAGVELSRRLGDQVGEGYGLCLLGSVGRGRGRLSDALRLHERALAISEETGARNLEAFVRNELGLVLRACGQPAAAVHQHETVIRLAAAIDDKYELDRARRYRDSVSPNRPLPAVKGLAQAVHAALGG